MSKIIRILEESMDLEFVAAALEKYGKTDLSDLSKRERKGEFAMDVEAAQKFSAAIKIRVENVIYQQGLNKAAITSASMHLPDISHHREEVRVAVHKQIESGYQYYKLLGSLEADAEVLCKKQVKKIEKITSAFEMSEAPRDPAKALTDINLQITFLKSIEAQTLALHTVNSVSLNDRLEAQLNEREAKEHQLVDALMKKPLPTLKPLVVGVMPINQTQIQDFLKKSQNSVKPTGLLLSRRACVA